MLKRILFYRNYSRYTGGHQKVRDYIGHLNCQSDFDVSLYLQNNATSQRALFENISNVQYQNEYNPSGFDFVFLAGLDWREYLSLPQAELLKEATKPEEVLQKDLFPKHNLQKSSRTPTVINLIQHIRHGDPKHPLFEFLKYPAIRICVSQAVKRAIEPHANGPCIHIPMGHQIPSIKLPKEYDLYILANKRAAWGKALAQWAINKGLNVLLHSELMPKQAVLNAMAQARISVCLPNPTEGFYLPGIEAMKLSDMAIVPDCKANNEYKRNFDNLIICSQQTEPVQQAIEQALSNINKPWHILKKLRGAQTVKHYSMDQEKQRFLKLLRDI